MKKILFISHSSESTGGGEDEFERLLKFFSNKKDVYDINGLFPRGQREEVFASYCSKYGTYKYGHLPVVNKGLIEIIKYFLKSLIQFIQILRFTFSSRYNLTVINVVVLVFPALIMRLLGSKVVIFVREDIYPIWLRHTVYKVLNICNCYFIPNSITKKEDIIRSTKTNKVNCVYPAIEDVFSYNENCLKDFFDKRIIDILLDNSKFKFLTVGPIESRKNQKLIVEALCYIKSSGSEIPHVISVGDAKVGSYYLKELKQLLNNNNLSEYFLFLGRLERELLYQVYNFINSTIICSLSEGLPITLVESFKFRKPVISTRVGGIPEIIIHVENGILIDFNEKDLAINMMKLMTDNTLSTVLADSAYLTYEEKFNFDKSFHKIDTIFQKIMACVYLFNFLIDLYYF